MEVAQPKKLHEGAQTDTEITNIKVQKVENMYMSHKLLIFSLSQHDCKEFRKLKCLKRVKIVS